ncbi:MAG TPA: hypothetical protein VMV95_03500 [Bacillota bacterium]|nr:hypothetical protein [Bacillota bacterium]
MAEKVKFGDVGKEIPFQKNKKWIYVLKDKTINIRFVGHQEKIYQNWIPSLRKFDFSETKGEKSSIRIMSLVIDREDNDIKPFCCPASVWSLMSPFGSNHDFKISRSGNGLNTRYNVESNGETEVSKEVEHMVKCTLEHYSLTDIFVNKVKWKLINEPKDTISRFDMLDIR